LVDTTIDLSSNPEYLVVREIQGTEKLSDKKCPHCGALMKEARVQYYDTEKGVWAHTRIGVIAEPFVGYFCPCRGWVNEAGESLTK
jgi:hypothetical protein